MKWIVKARANGSVCRRGYRPRLELLEDRLTPAPLQPVDGAQAVPIVGQDLPADDMIPLVSPQATLVNAGYVTGAATKGTAEAVAVQQSGIGTGSVFVVGLLQDPAIGGGDQLGYVAKYGPSGTLAWADALALFGPGDSVEFSGVAVDGIGNSYISGTGHGVMTDGDYGLVLQLDPMGTVVYYYAYGPGYPSSKCFVGL
jgi:hypothetical protein